MSGSDKTLYLFVKGNKNTSVYCITDSDGNRVQEDQFFNWDDTANTTALPESAELQLMCEALKFIEKSRTLNQCNLCIFTNSENVYLTVRSLIMPETTKKLFEQYRKLKESLVKSGKLNKIAEYWIPRKFRNELDRLANSIDSFKKLNKKPTEKIFRKGI